MSDYIMPDGFEVSEQRVRQLMKQRDILAAAIRKTLEKSLLDSLLRDTSNWVLIVPLGNVIVPLGNALREAGLEEVC